MTKDRQLDELVRIFTELKTDDDRFDFINDEATAREVYRLDKAGYLAWTQLLD